jgi:hypothetical protein
LLLKILKTFCRLWFSCRKSVLKLAATGLICHPECWRGIYVFESGRPVAFKQADTHRSFVAKAPQDDSKAVLPSQAPKPPTTFGEDPVMYMSTTGRAIHGVLKIKVIGYAGQAMDGLVLFEIYQ